MPSIVSFASLITELGVSGVDWTGLGTGGGTENGSLSERCVGSNSVHEIDGVYYVLVHIGNDFQFFRSTDEGVTWSAYGNSWTPEEFGGGMCSVRNGGPVIYVGYSRGIAPGHTANANSKYLYLAWFDTGSGTWSNDDPFDCSVDPVIGASFVVDGPFMIHVREGHLIFIISEALGQDPCIVEYDISGADWMDLHRLTEGEFHTRQAYDCSIAVQNDIHIFTTNSPVPSALDTYHSVFNGDNSIDPPSLMSYSPEVLDFAGDGVYFGYEKAGTFFLACGQDTGGDIFGRPAILYGSEGDWTMGPLLDAEFDAEYSLYSASLQLVHQTLIFTWRGLIDNADHYVERVGWAPEGSHATPEAWTWATAYDHNAPSPAVPDRTAPYYGGFPPYPSGFSTGLSAISEEDTAERVHLVTTIVDADGMLFSVYLFGIDVESFGNSFFFGGNFFTNA